MAELKYDCNIISVDYKIVAHNSDNNDEQIMEHRKCICVVSGLDTNNVHADISVVHGFKPKSIFEIKGKLALDVSSDEVINKDTIENLLYQNIIPFVARDFAYLTASITEIIYKDPLVSNGVFDDLKIKYR